MNRRDLKRLTRYRGKPKSPARPPDSLKRIEALTRNARNTWFILLGVLVFDVITLLSVRDIDFWGVNRATELPLVGVTVPTKLFFYAAPALTATVYAYFHLYLIRLIDALYAADARPGGGPLGDAVTPWLVSDALLDLRSRARHDQSTTRRMMELPAAAFNILLAWLGGLGVLSWLWWETGPARDSALTIVAAIMVILAGVAGLGSLVHLLGRLRKGANGGKVWVEATATFGLTICLAIIMIPASLGRTGIQIDSPLPDFLETLASLSLVGEAVVERPEGWLRRDFARREFRAIWCRQEGYEDCADIGDREKEFESEWSERRHADIAALVKPDVNRVKLIDAKRDVESAIHVINRSAKSDDHAIFALGPYRKIAPNLRSADLRGIFLTGLDLTAADLSNAELDGARLERTILYGALLDGIQMQEAYLQKANLSWSSLRSRPNLLVADLQGADLTGVRMETAILIGANMQNTDLSFSFMEGRGPGSPHFSGADFSASKNTGGALRNIDLNRATFDAETDWRNVFLDGSVPHKIEFAAQMDYPCQWATKKLNDEDFFGRWRWWIQINPQLGFPKVGWQTIAPLEWRDVPVNEGPDDCGWKPLLRSRATE